MTLLTVCFGGRGPHLTHDGDAYVKDEAHGPVVSYALELHEALEELVAATPTPLHNRQQVEAFSRAVRLLGELRQ